MKLSIEQRKLFLAISVRMAQSNVESILKNGKRQKSKKLINQLN